ncbi:MAG TPA: hypothetical protein VMU61_09645 [Candidatus Aquilonibacter sp.]|nr:hypothetical protein [Candidatus Aquilonibacter sp.]
MLGGELATRYSRAATIALTCENPRCEFRGFFRRLMRGSQDGVFLQGRWYCSLDCFEVAITDVFRGLLRSPDEPLTRSSRVPIGLLLLGRGVITEADLKLALRAQKEEAPDRLGRLLIRLGIASAEDISAALAAQWGCAFFPLEKDSGYRQCMHLLPRILLESCNMLPVHYLRENHDLFLAFSHDIDHTAVYSIERLLGGRTHPCVVTEQAMERAMEELRSSERRTEIVFDKHWEPSEMARTIRDYALKLGAEELRLVRPRRYLWARLLAAGRPWDLLFRLPPAHYGA